MKIAIVAPVHIPVSREWTRSLEIVAHKSKADIIIVDDSNGKPEVLESLPVTAKVFGYDEQKAYLGDALYQLFTQFHKSSSCKTFGMLYAYREEYDLVVVIDSDCVVPPNFIAEHLSKLDLITTYWENPIGMTGWFSRGFPAGGRAQYPVANMGLWEGTLDFSGQDRVDAWKRGVDEPKILPSIEETARGVIPLSGMNVAIWRKAIPGYLFLPNAEYGDYKFRRHDDIWGGYIFQQLMRKRWEVMMYGSPYVQHVSDVVPEEDAEQEWGARTMEAHFYEAVDDVMRHVKPDSYEGMFSRFRDAAERYPKEHIISVFNSAFDFWVRALKNNEHSGD